MWVCFDSKRSTHQITTTLLSFHFDTFLPLMATSEQLLMDQPTKVPSSSAVVTSESSEWPGAVLRGLESGKRMQVHAMQTVGPALTAVSMAYDTYHLATALQEDVQHYRKLSQEIEKLQKTVEKIQRRVEQKNLNDLQRQKAENALHRYQNELLLLKNCPSKVPSNTIRASGSIALGWAAGLAGGSGGAYAGAHTGAYLGTLAGGLPGMAIGAMAGAVIGAFSGGVIGGTLGSSSGELVAEKGLEAIIRVPLDCEVALDATDWVEIDDQFDVLERDPGDCQLTILFCETN